MAPSVEERHSSDTLVLIYRGLMQAIWEVSKLMAHRVSSETNRAQTRLDFNSPKWDDEEAKDADVVGLAAILPPI